METVFDKLHEPWAETAERTAQGYTRRYEKGIGQQLNEMEQMGLVTKRLYPETPPRAEYELTETGRALIPIIRLMDEWGLKHSCLFNEKGQYVGQNHGG